jgi:hypothetical protein
MDFCTFLERWKLKNRTANSRMTAQENSLHNDLEMNEFSLTNKHDELI